MYYTEDMTETQNVKQTEALRAFLTGRLHWRGVARLTGLSRENVLNLAAQLVRHEG